MNKVAFYTLGCKVNQYETNAMIQSFLQNKYEIVDFKGKSDIYIINTCTVTNISDRKSRQIIRRAKQLNSESVIVVTGCYAQTAREELEKIKEIDLIIGNTEKKDIVKILEEYNNSKIKTSVSDINNQKEFTDFGDVIYTEKTRAVIKVQDGCNNFCSYCIIPYAKGRVRSRKIKSILSEIRQIVGKGIKEVVITGIHVASYGIDFEEDIELIDLLEEIDKIKGLKRIRLGSLEPKLITKEFVARLSKLNKICDHFHLSLQSGCNETLKRMNRKYTIEEFEEGVKLLRKAFPNVALTTDIIVGFPGETEKEFNDTYNYLDKIHFTKMHVFKYSQRKGTIAAKAKEQIEPEVKEQRSKILLELSDKNEKEFLNKFIGKEVEILFEQKEGDFYKGHTTNYITVKSNGEDLENKIIKVKIAKIKDLELTGNVIEL